MEKKRSAGVRIFATSLLYFPIMDIIRFMIMYPVFYKNMRGTTILRSLYPQPFIGLLLFIIPVVIAIGILRLKKWAYWFLIIFTSFSIIRLLYSLPRLFQEFKYISTSGVMKYLLIGDFIIMLCYFIALFYFFTRSKVKEQFG